MCAQASACGGAKGRGAETNDTQVLPMDLETHITRCNLGVMVCFWALK